jgi:hypothetical protein
MPLQLFSGPIDYSQALAGPDIGASLLKGYQDAEKQKLLTAELTRQMERRKQLETAQKAAIEKPSLETFNALFVLDPENHEAIKSAWNAKDEDTRRGELAEKASIRGFLRAGQPERAKAVLQRRIEADKKAGIDTSDDEEIVGLIDEDPVAAGGVVDYAIASVIGPDKWSEAFGKFGEDARAAAKLPGEIAKAEADVAKTGAEIGKIEAETVEIAPTASAGRSLINAQVANFQSAIEERAARLDLDKDRLTSEVQLRLEEAAAKGTEVTPHFQKVLGDSVIAAESNRALGNRAKDLADRVAALGTGGTASQVTELVKGAFGNPTLLRKEYQALISSQAVKNLPPGPASDKDIQLAMKGFPAPNASAETMSSFLRGLAKMQDIAANREQAKADWISDNGSLGTAKRDLTVNGVRIPKGSTFGDFSKTQAAAERREAQPERSYMRFGNGQR